MAAKTEQGREHEAGPARRRFRAHPARLVPIPVCGLFILARQLGAVADEPVWVLIGVMAVVWLASTAVETVLPQRTTLRIAVEIASITLVIYTIGWGALLAIGFVFNVANHLDDEGSRVGRPSIIFSVLGIVLGECAVTLGIAKSLIPEPQGHGLAVLECAGVCVVIWMLTYTQRQKEMVETDLRRSEERLRALVQHASDVIMVMQADGVVSYTSPALLRLLGYRSLERIGVEILPDDEIARANEFFTDLMQRPGDVAWIELPLRHLDGTLRWFEVGVTNRLDDPAVLGMVCNLRDVSERRAAQEQLTFQAYHDALTRLPNRWQFLERLEQALFDAATHDRQVAVLFLDVDRFKLVNDTLGHDVGDRLLVTVAERLQSCVRPGDTVARFGGDEFSLLLGNLRDPDVAIRVAERVIEVMREPVIVGDHELFVSTSIGIAISLGGSERASDLLRQSDLAMYVAKDEGRARWELFDPQSAPHMMERLELEGDLWRAIDHGELVVQFQPELELATGRVIATEALVRWLHPTRGLIAPDRFVPFAEESGLIVAIDRLVLREACGWAHQWSKLVRSEHPIVVSVNLSPRFMREDDLVGEITRALDETGVDPHCLQIEITERSALTDLEVTSDEAASDPTTRRARGDRRLRHRLLVALVPEAAPDRRVEARQVVARHDRHGGGRRRDRAGRDHHGPCARDEDHGRRGRAGGAGGSAARARLRHCGRLAVVAGGGARPARRVRGLRVLVAGWPRAARPPRRFERRRRVGAHQRRGLSRRTQIREIAGLLLLLEAAAGIEPAFKVLQTSAWATRLRRRARECRSAAPRGGARRIPHAQRQSVSGQGRIGFARGACLSAAPAERGVRDRLVRLIDRARVERLVEVEILPVRDLLRDAAQAVPELLEPQRGVRQTAEVRLPRPLRERPARLPDRLNPTPALPDTTRSALWQLISPMSDPRVAPTARSIVANGPAYAALTPIPAWNFTSNARTTPFTPIDTPLIGSRLRVAWKNFATGWSAGPVASNCVL